MSKIFCLMGKSSTGKDTIFELLKNDRTLNLKPIIPYTTRPKRTNEQDGEAYYFITEDILDNYDKQKKVIEKRCYKTINGPWYYATIDDGQINLENNNYIIIVTLDAYISLVRYFDNSKIIPIYIEVEDEIRLQRAINREKKQKHPNYEELCRRFLADNKDFDEQLLDVNNINRRYQNLDLEECVKNIKAVINELI